jgi:hypothetical protein
MNAEKKIILNLSLFSSYRCVINGPVLWFLPSLLRKMAWPDVNRNISEICVKLQTWKKSSDTVWQSDILCIMLLLIKGRDISVSIVTLYGLDGPGIKSRWRRDFPHPSRCPGAHPASCTMGNGPFPGG